MKSKGPKPRIFVSDFETTVYEDQEYTEVWAAALVEIGKEDVYIYHSIDELFAHLRYLKHDLKIYYHNLKFDGAFWLSFLHRIGFKQGIAQAGEGHYFKENHEMLNGEYRYNISVRGQWYNICIKVDDFFIELVDSLKLLPFSVKQIGKAFNTKHKKLDMKYEGYRFAGCDISDEEKEYIKNDVLVVKEALEIMFAQGHNNLTIGACCLSEFKRVFGGGDIYHAIFPDLTRVPCPVDGYNNADAYIRKSYRGGWCYLKPEKANKIIPKGLTADVNSEYPSMMRYREYPVQYPHFFFGDPPEEALKPHRYYFLRVRCRFKLREGFLPFIQIKGNWLYPPTESLTTSDIVKDGIAYEWYKDLDGELKKAFVTLTLTCVDYKRFKEYYEVYEEEILDGCWFDTSDGIFDPYIDKYFKMKLENNHNKGLRTLAKLFLNNLYGKFSASMDSSFKVAFFDDEEVTHFSDQLESCKRPGYIAIGSAITSYARDFTIRAAQANYDRFIYSDTDSIHLEGSPEQVSGIDIHDVNLCAWKLESYWDTGLFVRQKTYIEHVTHEDGEPIDKPFYSVRCAGMPEYCKNLFLESIGYDTGAINKDKLSEEEAEFIKKRRSLSDFKIGLKVPGKLRPKRIRGGVVLVKTSYEMR